MPRPRRKIETLPERFADVLAVLDPGDWDRSYRPGGWTVREVVGDEFQRTVIIPGSQRKYLNTLSNLFRRAQAREFVPVGRGD